ncbi:hypothetical protein MTR_4g063995 [Medicago truncatula]|uniref:Uncharacterized protein n=1 Tax=Medicago truncatula TaxID=3880 RepID=A0A072UL90_MEDTR|nr:hypothetical protein MTR_4g063995 [Medicago truncatula]
MALLTDDPQTKQQLQEQMRKNATYAIGQACHVKLVSDLGSCSITSKNVSVRTNLSLTVKLFKH